MEIIERDEWGAVAPTCETPFTPKGIAVHYTASYADETGDPKSRMRAVQRFHMSPSSTDSTKPWCDIAYNFAFTRDGLLFEGRGWHRRSAAQGTNEGNRDYLAIVFLGTDKEGRDDVTSKGRELLGEFIVYAESYYKKKLDVQPHSHFHSTQCPGNELRNYIALRPWTIPSPPKPVKYPKRFYQWAAWRLGEGDYKEYGPKKGPRPNVPYPITPAYWAAWQYFMYMRKKNAGG